MGAKKRRVLGGVLAIVGYVLSPLSWWNDAFVNIPIAYLAASVIALINDRLFKLVFVSSYVASNIIGILMMYIGGSYMAGKNPTSRRLLTISIVVTLVYSGIIVALVEIGILKPLFTLIP